MDIQGWFKDTFPRAKPRTLSYKITEDGDVYVRDMDLVIPFKVAKDYMTPKTRLECDVMRLDRVLDTGKVIFFPAAEKLMGQEC